MSISAEEIYKAYPRKASPRYAVKCIIKAVKRLGGWGIVPVNTPIFCYSKLGEIPCEYLLRRVKEFAASPAAKHKKFTPYCSTWMNRERYYDDTADWHDGQSDSDRKQREEYGDAEDIVSAD